MTGVKVKSSVRSSVGKVESSVEKSVVDVEPLVEESVVKVVAPSARCTTGVVAAKARSNSVPDENTQRKAVTVVVDVPLSLYIIPLNVA